MKQRRQRKICMGTMTPKILKICVEVADQDGFFYVKDAMRELRDQYPSYFTLYIATHMTMANLVYRGYTKRTNVRGMHYVYDRTVDQLVKLGVI